MTIVVAVVMPACILSAFFLMRLFGFTLNIMSMLGLGLSIGTLVVNAIVILENVTRRLDARGLVLQRPWRLLVAWFAILVFIGGCAKLRQIVRLAREK